MADVAFGVVGAGIGAAFGNPALGFSVGVALGGALFPPKQQPQELGKLSDLRVHGSGWGVAIPQVYGRSRVAGNIIWATDLVETVTTRKRGGKGTKRTTEKQYTYTASFATLLARGPIGEVRRIWAEDRTLYDNTVIPAVALPSNITIFLGTETQAPWSVIEADQGVGNVPAFRGECYLGFQDQELGSWGNRIPIVEAELGAIQPIPNQLLWYKADKITGLVDADPIVTVPDQSGNGWDGTNTTGSNRLTYETNEKNGLPAMRGAGSDFFEVVGLTATADDWSCYCVCNPTEISFSDGWLFSSNNLKFYNSDDSSASPEEVGYNDGAFKDIAAPTTGWQILEWHLDQTANTGEAFRNGVSLGTNTYPTQRDISGTVGFASAGPPPNSPTSFVGDIGEFVLYKGVHTAAQRAEMRAYLNTRWAIF